MYREHLNKENGFTLIEVILSIAILSIVSVVVLRLFVASHDLNEASRIADQASNASVNVIETVKAYRNLDNMIEEINWLSEDGPTLSGSILFNEAFEVDSQGDYVLTCRLEASKSNASLYDLAIEVHNDTEMIVSYKTSHYFMEGVN